MESIRELYNKFRGYIENGIFIIVLVFYPLIKINQGLDVADTSYSLANFQYFGSSDGTWMVATYLANAAGALLMKLPRGGTLVGMNFYTGLIISAAALMFYFELRKKIPAPIVFLGEFIAIGLCWCPSVILYNYLSYFLMGAGMLLLYKGSFAPAGKYKKYLFLAGVCLGANVTVRMPNVVQAAFILALWYAAFLKKESLGGCVKDTMICITGYLTGFGIPFITICVRYGISAYPEMVKSMFAMTDKATDYKPLSMLSGMFGDYIKGLYWLIFAALALGFLYVLYLIRRKFAPTRFKTLFCLVCAAVCCVLIRFYWGRGMFNFSYYYYGSIYWWAVLFLILALVCAVSLLFSRTRGAQDKVLAALVIIQIFVTPLGSNNALYPIINNLFIAAPFTLWTVYTYFAHTGGKLSHIPFQTMLTALIVVLFIQSVGFHMNFVFNDGVWGEKRDTLITDVPKCGGIYTTRENAELLTDLVNYASENELSGRGAIFYGEVPGLSYFLDMPAAVSTSWPDLDSYSLGKFEEDMRAVEAGIDKDRPVVIVSSGVAAYIDEDAQAYKWFGVDAQEYDGDEKLAILVRFLGDYGYEETFCNMKYAIYE